MVGQQDKLDALISYGEGPRAIYELVKAQILAGTPASGEELKIQPLAERLGVSIVPVREAIRMLAADRLIEIRPRRSPLVVAIDERELVEINQIRLELEPFTLAAAIEHHTPKTIARCRRIVRRDEASTDLWEKVELNRRFHLALLAPAPLKRTPHIIRDQYDGISRAAQFLVVDKGAYLGQPHTEHEEILEAVERGDGKAAVALMRRHISAATERARARLAVQAASPLPVA